jgi:hypothetical protein
MDPVPEGALFAEPGPDLDSLPVVNRHSIRKDHTSYWGNVEQVLAPVVAIAAETAGGADVLLADGDGERLVDAATRRTRRGYGLWAGQAATAAAAISLLVSLHERTFEAIGDRILAWVKAIPLVPEFDPPDDLAIILGGVVIVAGCLLWYVLVVVPLWKRLQSHATGCLIERRVESPQRLTQLVLRLAIVVPAACLFAPVARYGDVPTDEGGWMLAVPLGLMAAAVAFVLFWRVAPRQAQI